MQYINGSLYEVTFASPCDSRRANNTATGNYALMIFRNISDECESN